MVKTFPFFENQYALSEGLIVTVPSIMAENNIQRFSVRGART